VPQIHIPFWKIEEHIDFINSLRLDLEIYINSESLDTLSKRDITNTRDRFKHSPTITIHGPFMDISPGAVDPRVRDITLDRFLKTIEITEPLSPKVFVFHSGYEKWRYGLRHDIWLEQSLRTWTEIYKKTGARIAIENIFEDEPTTLESLMRHLIKEGVSGLGICFDTGHFNLFSKVPLRDWLSSIGDFITELHLHDNNKLSDAHLPIGDGNFDFPSLFEWLSGKKDIIYTIEAHSPEDALRSMKSLEGLFQRYFN